MRKDYNPRPIDTSDIVLPEELSSLCEELSKNVHDVWARQRLDEGWKYGKVRDDSKRTHPCLVPYELLPESEKEYDRRTSLETIKLIIKLGYRIVKP